MHVLTHVLMHVLMLVVMLVLMLMLMLVLMLVLMQHWNLAQLKEKFRLFSAHNGSLLRRQPRATLLPRHTTNNATPPSLT